MKRIVLRILLLIVVLALLTAPVMAAPLRQDTTPPPIPADFGSLVVGGVPLLVLIFGLVEFVKRMGVKGRATEVASMIIGVALGVGYQLSKAMPASSGEWFTITVFGLGLGLVASGFYDFANSRFPATKSGP